MVYIYVCHFSSCSSSWTRLFPKPAIYQESTFEVCEEIVSDNWKVDQGSGEITGLSTIDWNQPMWTESSLLCDRAVRIVKSKTFVFADSVLCLGGISTEPVQAWKDKIKWYFGDTPSQRFGSNRWGTNGIRVETCPRIHYIGNPRRDSKHGGGIKVWTWAIHRKDHLHVNVQWHGMGEHKETMKIIWRIPWMLQHTPRSSRTNVGHFWDFGYEKKLYGTHVSKPNGEWNKTAEVMMLNFAESGHRVFRATSALERGELKSEECGKKSIHCNGSDDTIELILRTVSVYGALADLCKELNPDSRNQTEFEICESLVIPTDIPYANAIFRVQHHWHRATCCKNTTGNSQNFLMIRNCRNYAPTLVS